MIHTTCQWGLACISGVGPDFWIGMMKLIVNPSLMKRLLLWTSHTLLKRESWVRKAAVTVIEEGQNRTQIPFSMQTRIIPISTHTTPNFLVSMDSQCDKHLRWSVENSLVTFSSNLSNSYFNPYYGLTYITNIYVHQTISYSVCMCNIT